MIRSIPAAWRTNMQSASSEDRAYIDFRGIDYPDVGSGSPTFSLGREDNLIDRGNCESATAPGILGETGLASNCTWARSAVVAHGGDYSFLLTKTIAAGTASVASPQDNSLTTDMHGIVPGETVEYSCWVYIPSVGGPDAAEVSIQFAYYDSASWTVTNYAASTQDAWEKLSVSATIPSTATGVLIRIIIASTAADTEFCYTDDAIMKRHSVPGSHYLSGGYSENLVELADTGTIQIKFHPTFAHTIARYYYVKSWYVSATQRLGITYYPVGDTFWIIWQDGGDARLLSSAQYDDGSAERNINQWITLTFAYDLTTGTTAGSSLWMNKTQDDTAWNAVIDVKSTTFNKMQLRAYNGSAGGYEIAYALYIPNYVATDADVQNDFKDVLDEQIYWSLDGHATGKTRCNVTKFLTGINTEKATRAMLSGNYGANKMDLELKSLDGEFADDQYAAFDPANSVYNGLVSQKYMQNGCRAWLENWYNGDHDQRIVGRVDDSYFRRRTMRDGISFVSISVDDYVAEFAKKRIEKAKNYDSKDFTDATESNSLIHLIARIQSSKKVRNYAHNSGFENATITNAWTATALTLSRDTVDEYFGTACAKLVYDNIAGGTQNIYQSISFDNDEKLNVGDTWTWKVYLKCAGAFSKVFRLKERDSAGENDETTKVYTIAGGEGYVGVAVTHTITDSDSDELRLQIDMDDNVTAYVDGCMLTRGNRAPKFYVDNTAETLDADDYVEGEYDTIGFDLDTVNIEHPWKRIEEGTTVWSNLTDLAAATIPIYFGMNECGTLELRAVLQAVSANPYTDPIAVEDIGESDILINVQAGIAGGSANKVIVKGAGYAIYTNKTCIWKAKEMGNFVQGADGRIAVVVANGGKFPDPEEYGEYYAYYARRPDFEGPWN